MKAEPTSTTKPLLRGHFHQAAFFIALGACIMLLGQTHGAWATGAVGVYSLSLTGLFGVSALPSGSRKVMSLLIGATTTSMS